MKFTQIPSTTFQELQLNAGILSSEFVPATGTLTADSILGATSGGIKFSATLSFTDMGEDVDNCPKNMLELKKLDSWEIKMSGTYVTADTKQATSSTAVKFANNVLVDVHCISAGKNGAVGFYNNVVGTMSYGGNGGCAGGQAYNGSKTLENGASIIDDYGNYGSSGIVGSSIDGLNYVTAIKGTSYGCGGGAAALYGSSYPVATSAAGCDGAVLVYGR